mgnify:FL=1|jgi:hypothetical protein
MYIFHDLKTSSFACGIHSDWMGNVNILTVSNITGETGVQVSQVTIKPRKSSMSVADL